jgi:holo-[acyl-carrier protein] synthase
MIIGIGIDIVEIKRIEELMHKHGNAFLEKVFTKPEIAESPGKAKTGLYYAGRWAVKEAFYKALPDSCQKLSSFKSIQVVGGGQKPQVVVCDERLTDAINSSGITGIHCTISHERSMCVANVVLEG